MLVEQGPFNHVRYDTIGDEIVIVIHHPNEEMFLHFQEYGFYLIEWHTMRDVCVKKVTNDVITVDPAVDNKEMQSCFTNVDD